MDNRFNRLTASQRLTAVAAAVIAMNTSCAFAWGGQSLEGGSTLAPDSKGVMRRAYLNAPAQNYYEPDPNNPGASGSYMTPLLQKLAVNDKLKVFGYNMAVGGTSAIKDWCGVQEIGTGGLGWQPNTPYRYFRAPGTAQDITMSVTTNSTTTATVVSSLELVVGHVITGNANITDGTTITAISTNGTTITLSAAATGTAASVYTVFTSPNVIAGDPGHRGSVILAAGRLWEATQGCKHLARINSPTKPAYVGNGANAGLWRTNLTLIAKNINRTSSNAAPPFSGSAAVGDTQVDNGTGATGGGIVWTCRAIVAQVADADGLRVCRVTDIGFDPYFLLETSANALMAAPVSSDRRFFGFANATGDAQLRNLLNVRISAANLETLYARAHAFICTYMINPVRGIRTIHWGSLFYPAFAAADFEPLEKALYGVSDIAAPINVPGSLLYTYLTTNSSYPLGVPGGTIGNYYVIPSLLRLLGLDVTHLLQPSSPHPDLAGNFSIADVLYPYLRRVLLDVAT